MHVGGVPKPFQQLIHAQTFKGTVSREYFLMACNYKSVHSVHAVVVLKKFSVCIA
jgi:hypothetical protein